MAKICSKCNRKLGFFEKIYDYKYCEECFEKVLAAEEAIRRKREEEKIQREREEKLERIKKEKREKEEKLKPEKDYFLYTKYFLGLVFGIDNTPFHYQDIFKSSLRKSKFQIVELLLEEILLQLPKDYNLRDIKKMTTYRASAKIIDKALKMNVGRELDYQKYFSILNDNQNYSSKPNYGILDDIEENSLFLDNGYLLNFGDLMEQYLKIKIDTIENLNKIISNHEKNLRNPDKYDVVKCREYIRECELEKTYEIINIYYLYAMFMVYFIYLNKIIDKIISESELYNIYIKLREEIHNDNYIREKLYPIYNSLYKNDFDIVFETEEEFQMLIDIIKVKEEIIEKEDFIDIENSILKLDIAKYINYLDDEEMINSVVNEIAENICIYKENLSINDVLDIFVYSRKDLKVIDEIKKQQATKEKERILNGIFGEEKELKNKMLDFSNISNGYEFEDYVANLYSSLGYEIKKVTSKSGDQGADVIMEKDGLKYAVQVKFYSNTVGNKAIQEIVAAKSYYKTDRAMVVTNSTYTRQAEELAKANDVILVNGLEIEKLKKEIK